MGEPITGTGGKGEAGVGTSAARTSAAVPADAAGVGGATASASPSSNGPRAVRVGAAFRAAFPLTVPIAAGFLFLGCSYGLLMHAKGFAFWYPVAMAYFIFAGSMEFVTVNLLLSAFAPLAAFLLSLMVNARHLFYGLSMLGKFRGLGWKKPYLIFAMCDESFAINSSTKAPEGVDRGWFMLFVSLLNRWYWIAGTALGWLVGGLLPLDTKGIEFVLTALFLTIFLGQWTDANKTEVPAEGRASTPARMLRRHVPALVGVLATAVCLVLLGPDRFMIPSMASILVLFLVLRPWLDDARTQPRDDAVRDDAAAAGAVRDGTARDDAAAVGADFSAADESGDVAADDAAIADASVAAMSADDMKEAL